jgi:hypothetical protein
LSSLDLIWTKTIPRLGWIKQETSALGLAEPLIFGPASRAIEPQAIPRLNRKYKEMLMRPWIYAVTTLLARRPKLLLI